MKIIYKPRLAGKTTELIKLASKGKYKLIVCYSRQDADRIFKHSLEMEKRKEIKHHPPLPITYDEFLRGKYYGKNIESFLIDNAEFLITYLSKGVPIEAITLTKENKEG